MTRRRPDILYECTRFLVANKPKGILSTPLPHSSELSLQDQLSAMGSVAWPVHRLDRETTGAIVFARSEVEATRLQGLFRDRNAVKTYQAVAQGWVDPKIGTIDARILDLGAAACISRKGKEARTHYKTLERPGPCSWLEINIRSGRHNQIRLHFAHMGHPLMGERKFAKGKWSLVPFRRVLLHASRLEIPDADNSSLVIDAPLPDDFREGIDVARETLCDQDPGIMAKEGIMTTQNSQTRHRR